jgi:transposase
MEVPTKGVHKMPGATPSYPPQFKREALRLVRSSPDSSVAKIAKELGVSDNSLRNWVKHFEIDQGERGEITTRSARNSGSAVKRTRKDAELTQRIREIHTRSLQI